MFGPGSRSPASLLGSVAYNTPFKQANRQTPVIVLLHEQCRKSTREKLAGEPTVECLHRALFRCVLPLIECDLTPAARQKCSLRRVHTEETSIVFNGARSGLARPPRLYEDPLPGLFSTRPSHPLPGPPNHLEPCPDSGLYRELGLSEDQHNSECSDKNSLRTAGVVHKHKASRSNSLGSGSDGFVDRAWLPESVESGDGIDNFLAVFAALTRMSAYIPYKYQLYQGLIFGASPGRHLLAPNTTCRLVPPSLYLQPNYEASGQYWLHATAAETLVSNGGSGRASVGREFDSLAASRVAGPADPGVVVHRGVGKAAVAQADSVVVDTPCRGSGGCSGTTGGCPAGLCAAARSVLRVVRILSGVPVGVLLAVPLVVVGGQQTSQDEEERYGCGHGHGQVHVEAGATIKYAPCRASERRLDPFGQQPHSPPGAKCSETGKAGPVRQVAEARGCPVQQDGVAQSGQEPAWPSSSLSRARRRWLHLVRSSGPAAVVRHRKAPRARQAAVGIRGSDSGACPAPRAPRASVSAAAAGTWDDCTAEERRQPADISATPPLAQEAEALTRPCVRRSESLRGAQDARDGLSRPSPNNFRAYYSPEPSTAVVRVD
ncbi:hypothetical protein Micbo1qcDRAFT_198924 [Microdochium bolleyi]|uniref:Uncharacterized protein n=1 Tax=Microdochium bolleyi TaxID=196109 RepID=A0A136IJP3_9PEZI|nr:hypothetical protein Micbo1qcDRAFT_198924 [Microdochium bolleyi]